MESRGSLKGPLLLVSLDDAVHRAPSYFEQLSDFGGGVLASLI